MKRFQGKRFIDDYVDLTGSVCHDCYFDGCVVELRAGPRFDIQGNNFQECQFVGDGWWWDKPYLEVRLP